jgi:hypothetical protein
MKMRISWEGVKGNFELIGMEEELARLFWRRAA